MPKLLSLASRSPKRALSSFLQETAGLLQQVGAEACRASRINVPTGLYSGLDDFWICGGGGGVVLQNRIV